MRVTRRYWVTVALVGLLALWAVVLDRVLVLIGAAGVTAWLLVRQYRFVRTTSMTIADLTVDQRLDRTRVTADETTLGILEIETDDRAGVPLRVHTTPPVGSSATTVSCELSADESTARTTFEITWPIAGTFEFEQPTVTVSDPCGLFSQTTPLGPMPAVTVEPRAPRDIHIGEGGNRVAAGFGDHDAGQTGGGLTPAEVRKYVPGDSVRQIDWKATARLDEPHIREFEAETDLETVLLVDHRATMATGPRGERKLDFARQVALALVESVHERGDPLACTTVGDDGITTTFELRTDDSQYRTIAQHLRALEPTDHGTARRPSGPSNGIDPVQARRTAERLSGDTPFAERLRPFFAAADIYVQQVAEQPLFAGIQASTARLDGTVRTIIVTDDKRRTELREAVKAARTGTGQVVVFLTPSVLYASQPLADVDDAYQRYTDFERFRREIASLPRVTAFEVGPEDHLTTVLAAGRHQRKAEQ